MKTNEKSYWVYILASRPKGVLYIGISNDLVRRVWEHKQKVIKCFTKHYNVDQLVYFEQFIDPASAIAREKQLKKWRRDWKCQLIEKGNPAWKDRFDTIAS